MGLKKRLKEEAHFIKLGAKALPKAVGQKAKGWAKGQFEAAKQRAIMEKEIDVEAKKAEAEAYKEERIKLAKVKAIERARQRAKGGSGILAQLGEAGERMSLSDLLGVPEGKQGSQEMGSPNDYIFSGLGQKKKKRRH
jgi:hypothetical protein